MNTAADAPITHPPAIKLIKDNGVSERATARLCWEDRHVDRMGPDRESSVKSSLQHHEDDAYL